MCWVGNAGHVIEVGREWKASFSSCFIKQRTAKNPVKFNILLNFFSFFLCVSERTSTSVSAGFYKYVYVREGQRLTKFPKTEREREREREIENKVNVYV